MAVSRGLPLLLATLLACSGGNGEAGPDAAFAGSCPEGGIEDGVSCAIDAEVRCMIHQEDCGLAEVCQCEDGAFACRPPDFDADCSGIEDADCAIEGVYGCYLYPTSGTTRCEDGEWVSDYSCPAGCPGPDDSPPASGDPCSVATGEVCPYGDQDCECVDGAFLCCELAPCTE